MRALTEADEQRRRRAAVQKRYRAKHAPPPRESNVPKTTTEAKTNRQGIVLTTDHREIPRRPAFSSQWQPDPPPPEPMPTAAQVALVLDAIRSRPLAALDVGRVSGLGYHDAFRTLELLVSFGTVTRKFPSMYAVTGAARSQ